MGGDLPPPGVGAPERATRSVELAAIGRRVCESEWDLLDLMGVDRPQEDGTSHEDGPGTVPVTSTVFGRPTVAELVEP